MQNARVNPRTEAFLRRKKLPNPHLRAAGHKKTAERLILELKDKMGEIPTGVSAALPDTDISEADDDAVTALIGLGFSRTESVAAVKKAKLSGATNIQQTISYALKSMR